MKYLLKDVVRKQLEEAFHKGRIPVGFKQKETKYLQFSEMPTVGVMKIDKDDEKISISWIDVQAV